MKENYFRNIDTKDKAYWLGFIYAEGYMETRNQKPFRLGIHIGKDDETIIDRFIETLELNPEKKHYRERDHCVYVKFANKTMVKDLVKLGVVPRKSNIIELPYLSSRELYLAFLLGFYDGDGKTGTTRIVTGSLLFLEQIKEYFKLPNKIYEKNNRGYIGERLVISHGYSMSLGVELFNEMLKNYQYSLPRKRHLVTYKERMEKIRNSNDYINKRKITFTKEELKKLVWKLSLRKIASRYNVNAASIRYWVIKWKITLPPLGYWSRTSTKQKQKNKKKG